MFMLLLYFLVLDSRDWGRSEPSLMLPCGCFRSLNDYVRSNASKRAPYAETVLKGSMRTIPVVTAFGKRPTLKRHVVSSVVGDASDVSLVSEPRPDSVVITAPAPPKSVASRASSDGSLAE